jgi:hypothetical protein
MILKRKLTIEERKELLDKLFYFDLVKEGHNHHVIYDSEGEEFYGGEENCKFNFDTLEDFFKYQAHLSYEEGYKRCQKEIKRALGL